jgi:hypothetical protein
VLHPLVTVNVASPHVDNPDQIHPDWEAKLAAVQAAVARRANRRIIMRQVGDRLVPVGITSGRIHPLGVEAAGAEGDGGGNRRSRRRQQQQQELNSFLGNMGFGNRDLEEVGTLSSPHSLHGTNVCAATVADDDGGNEAVSARTRSSAATRSRTASRERRRRE